MSNSVWGAAVQTEILLYNGYRDVHVLTGPVLCKPSQLMAAANYSTLFAGARQACYSWKTCSGSQGIAHDALLHHYSREPCKQTRMEYSIILGEALINAFTRSELRSAPRCRARKAAIIA